MAAEVQLPLPVFSRSSLNTFTGEPGVHVGAVTVGELVGLVAISVACTDLETLVQSPAVIPTVPIKFVHA